MPQYVLFLKLKLFSNKGEEFSVRELGSARFFWEDPLSVCLDDLSPPPPYVARLIKRRSEVILCRWPSRAIGLSGEDEHPKAAHTDVSASWTECGSVDFLFVECRPDLPERVSAGLPAAPPKQ